MPTRIKLVISTVKGWRPNQLDDGMIAEGKGFEPLHRVTDLADFKSAPL